jgi:hypothetical protein
VAIGDGVAPGALGDEGPVARRGTTGASLAELLVALTILAIGGALTTRLLSLAARDLESAEVGLRATLFMAELHDARNPGSIENARSAGPGMLVHVADAEGKSLIRYLPPHPGSDASGESGMADSKGFLEPRSWSLQVDG